MSLSNFLRVEKEQGGRTVSYILHTVPPKFAIEVDPAYDPEGQPGHHFIKSLRLANSWHGDYHRCFPLLNRAETFFRQSASPGTDLAARRPGADPCPPRR